jgi:diguanylate cyclase (GGDEF)-like protein
MNIKPSRILAIDDTPANLVALGLALQSEFDLEVATSGLQGIHQAILMPPDLILLDVMMPEVDGYETFRRLKSDPLTRDIPVIFVTAQNSAEDETRALDAGAADFIAKPINPTVLRARVRTQLTIKHQDDALRAMAFVDGLTGVANRRQFDQMLATEWRSCRRSASSLAVAMIDIDYFKPFNDAQGHQAGDACLVAVARALAAGAARPRDLVARYGGEEFVCVMPESALPGAMATAEALRLAVQGLAIAHGASPVAPVVTVSIGVVAVTPTAGAGPDELVAAADAQLYAAKRGGRNRLCWRAFESPA